MKNTDRKKNHTTKPTKKLSKIDLKMLDSADKIHRNLVKGIAANIYAHELDQEGIGLIKRLVKKEYVEIIKNPNRQGHAYKWLHGQLRPYQVYLKNLILTSKENVLIAALPTGTGKTKTALALIQEYERTLFVTPRINLTHQTAGVFGELLDDVGVIQGTDSKNEDAAHVVANLQTLEKRIDDMDLSQYDLVIFDEAHYSHERIKSLVSKFYNSKVVLLTATPFHADGKPLGDNIIQPFKPQYFIDRGYLAKLKPMQALTVDNSKLKKSASTGDFTQQSIDEVTDSVFDMNVIDATADALVGKTLVFAASIAHCDKLAIAYKGAGFEVLTLHSKVDNPSQVLQDFRDDKAQILVSVDMIGFGTDLPDVMTGVIARPINSKSLWRQMVGRILRPGKKEALLLDCAGNLKRLGNPLADVRPSKKRTVIDKASCHDCGYEKAPYLKSFNQNFDVITRLYKCAACGSENQKQMEVETVECEACNRFHLSTDTVIHHGKEILKCECSHVTTVTELDNLKLVLSDDELLKLKLKACVDKATDEPNMIELMTACVSILGAVNKGVDREKVLLMLERKSVIDTAAVLQPKQLPTLAPLPASKQLVVPVPADKSTNSVQALLASVNGRYQQAGKKGLTNREMKAFVNDFNHCSLPYKEKSVRTRLTRIEQEGMPLNRIKGFIGWIEENSQKSH